MKLTKTQNETFKQLSKTFAEILFGFLIGALFVGKITVQWFILVIVFLLFVFLLILAGYFSKQIDKRRK